MAYGQYGLRLMQGQEMNKSVVITRSGGARVLALVLITISASICVTCEGLLERVMGVYSE